MTLEPTLGNLAVILIATAMILIGGAGAVLVLYEGLREAFSEREDH